MAKRYYLSAIFFVSMLSFVYEGYAVSYTISGYVTRNLSGYPAIENVTMTASNGGGTTQTQANGFYSFSLPLGWSGTITPSKSDYQFTPTNRSYTNLTNDQNAQDFEGTYLFTLSGYVRTINGPIIDGLINCTEPIVGVRVYEIYYEDTLSETYTDQNGYYFFKIAQGWYGGTPYSCIDVDLPGRFVIFPREICMYEIWGNVYNKNFKVWLDVVGCVKDEMGNLIDGVTITVITDDGKTAVGVTGEGSWSYIDCFELGLNYNFSGTITPSKPGWKFEPEMYQYSNLVNMYFYPFPVPNFIGTPLPDLQCNPTSLTINPTTVQDGNTFEISGVIGNNGVVSTGDDFQVNVFICPDKDALDFQSSCFVGQFSVSALDSGSNSNFNETVTIPDSVNPGVYYAWVSIDPNNAVEETDETNNQQFCNTELVVGSTGIAPENTQVITQYNIRQNYPNPLNPGTRIQYELPKLSHVILGIYNLMGQEVVRFVDEVKDMGIYSVDWDGRDSRGEFLPSGVYIYHIKAGEFIESKKLILNR